MRIGPWINLDNIVPRSDSSNNDDGFPTVEELLSSGGKDAARPSGSQGTIVQITVPVHGLIWLYSRQADHDRR